jgi:hypothetical protein
MHCIAPWETHRGNQPTTCNEIRGENVTLFLTTAFAPKLLSLTCSSKALGAARPQSCMCQAASKGTMDAHHTTMI